MSIFGDAFGGATPNGGASTVSVPSGEIEASYKQFMDCPVAQHAYDAYMSELDRCELKWDSGVDKDVPVPLKWQWRTFIRDTARNFLVCGFSSGVRIGIRQGLVVCRALHPREMNCYYDGQCRLRVKPNLSAPSPRATSHTRTTVTMDAPCLSTGQLQSCSYRALPSSVMYSNLVSNYVNRDNLNTRPSVYTTVSKDLHTGSGTDTSTWFTPRGAGFNDRDFNSLVNARERTLSSLTSITNARRATETGTQEKLHAEHIVTDGQSFSEARQLQSQPENRNFKDQLMLQIYKFYKVPPQAVFGEQVNAERAGVGLGSSSAAMQARCVQNWELTIQNFIKQINEALQSNSTTPSGSYLILERPVTADSVGKLLPYLKPRAVIDHFSRIYGLSKSDFDAEAISGSQSQGPADRKQKRTRIEREQAFATAP